MADKNAWRRGSYRGNGLPADAFKRCVHLMSVSGGPDRAMLIILTNPEIAPYLLKYMPAVTDSMKHENLPAELRPLMLQHIESVYSMLRVVATQAAAKAAAAEATR